LFELQQCRNGYLLSDGKARCQVREAITIFLKNNTDNIWIV